MSVYQVQQCLFDYLRALEGAPRDQRPPMAVEGYELTPVEQRALVDGDVDALYRLGVHPVMINGYCRAMGYKRADYRPLLERGGRREQEDPMADIVMAYCASHAPMMTADRESAPPEKADALLRRARDGARPGQGATTSRRW